MNMTAAWLRPVLIIVGSFLLWGCASQLGADNAPVSSLPAEQRARHSPQQVSQRKIQIQEVRIPAIDLNRYPELTEQQVGLGVCRILVSILSDTGRFDLFEAPQKVVQRLSDQWQQTKDGIDVHYDPDAALAKPEFLIFVKMFDIDVCKPEKRNILGRLRPTCNTRVGVQVRIANSSGQFIPGSTHPLSPQGRYRHIKHLSRFGDTQTAFAQSAVGKVTVKAVRYAVLQALERFDRQGW